MNCGCEKKQEYGEPVMYIGDGITTEFPIPFGHLGDMITIKTPECGISVKVERDCAYQVVDGVVKFLTPPPKGTVVAFAPDGCLLNARGEWSTEKIYRRGDVITHDDVCYFAKDTSCGAEPLTHSDKWLAVSGVSATLQIGTVTTAPAGTPASVTNRGTAREAILDFVIPGGAKGDKGDTGDIGAQYDTVAEMVADAGLRNGDYAQTGGYYSYGDKGACLYRISNTSGSLKIRLNSGLYAEVAESEITSGKLGIIGTKNAGLLQTAIDTYARFVIDTDITTTHKLVMNKDGRTLIIRSATITYTGSDEAAIHATSSNSVIAGDGRAAITGQGTGAGILLGGEGKTKNCLSNVIKTLNIAKFESGISIYNNQLNGLAVYFHNIGDMNIQDCKNGILLTGWANANIVSNIIFWRCGSANNSGGAVVMKTLNGQYPLENNISHIFHHQSTDATTLNIEKTNFSVFTGIICEQGGSGAKSLVITDDGTIWNIFSMCSNVSAFRQVPSACYNSNIFMDLTGLAAGAVSSNSLTGTTLSYKKQNSPMTLKRYYRGKNVFSERARPLLLTLLTGRKIGCGIFLKVRVRYGNAANVMLINTWAEKSFICKFNADATSVEELESLVIHGNLITYADNEIHIVTPDNGTNVDVFLLVEVEQTVYNMANDTVYTLNEELFEEVS